MDDIDIIKKLRKNNHSISFKELETKKDELSNKRGIYTIWKDNKFLYVGTSDNLYKRLKQHHDGRRAGDQFCVYIFDYFILPNLTKEKINNASRGKLSIDKEIKKFVYENLSFCFLFIEKDDNDIKKIEKEIIDKGLGDVGKPLLNYLFSKKM